MRRPDLKTIIVAVILAILSSTNAVAMVGAPRYEVAQSNQWIPIPAWLAGTWQAKDQTFLDSYDCRTGRHLLEQPTTLQINRIRMIGTQQDDTGRIWHYAATPYVREIEAQTHLERQIIDQLVLLRSESNQVIFCTTGRVTRWSKGTKELLDYFYERTVVAYTPVDENTMKSELVVTDFDPDKQPLHSSHSVCLEQRVKPFAVIDRDERGDLRSKFLQFLSQKNRRAGQ